MKNPMATSSKIATMPSKITPIVGSRNANGPGGCGRSGGCVGTTTGVAVGVGVKVGVGVGKRLLSGCGGTTGAPAVGVAVAVGVSVAVGLVCGGTVGCWPMGCSSPRLIGACAAVGSNSTQP